MKFTVKRIHERQQNYERSFAPDMVHESLPNALEQLDPKKVERLLSLRTCSRLIRILVLPTDASKWGVSGARFRRFGLVWSKKSSNLPRDVLLKENAAARDVNVSSVIASCDSNLAPTVWAWWAGDKKRWILMDRLRAAPLGPLWDGREFGLLLDAMIRLHCPKLAWVRSNFPHDLPEVTYEWASDQVEKSIRIANRECGPEIVSVLRRIYQSLNSLMMILKNSIPWTLLHGDCHLGNAGCRWKRTDNKAQLFDWSLALWGPCLWDLSYFMACVQGEKGRAGLSRLAYRYFQRFRKRMNVNMDYKEFTMLLDASTLLMFGAGLHLVGWALNKSKESSFLDAQVSLANLALGRLQLSQVD